MCVLSVIYACMPSTTYLSLSSNVPPSMTKRRCSNVENRLAMSRLGAWRLLNTLLARTIELKDSHLHVKYKKHKINFV